jgi:sugar transferase (PEP-CTERM/EpsH1 system associated)
MSRLLMIAHRMPFPPNKGDKIRAYHVLTHLAQRHDVSLACLIDDPADLKHVETLRSQVGQLAVGRIDGRLRRLASARSLLRRRSVTVTHFHVAALQAQIDAWIDHAPFDGVMCSSAATAEYVFASRHRGGRLSHAVKAMDLIDVDSAKWAQYARGASPWSSWIYRHEAKWLGAYEQHILSEFDRTFLVSPAEAEMLGDVQRDGRVGAFSNGVDLDYFRPGAGKASAQAPIEAGSRPLIVFTGVMDYRPNVEGVEWFARKVFPMVRARLPEACFAIVGSRPNRQVQVLAQLPGILVTGFVDDVRVWLDRADVCVAPLQIARGIQNKVLEAMAMGKPVVVTPQAHEGIAATAQADLLVAASPAEFAQSVVALIDDPERAAHMGSQARIRMENGYRWSSNLAVLDEVFA